MVDLYHNCLVRNRVAASHPIGRTVDRLDGSFERVVTVVVITDRETGWMLWSLEIVEDGPGPGMTPQVLGSYPFPNRLGAARDAMLVGRHFGLRVRIATETQGWEWLRTDADIAYEASQPADPASPPG